MSKKTAALRGLVATSLIGAAVTAAPVAATAAPATAQANGSCTVQSAEMTWGVKESFRSYISGSIANGEWTVSDDMRYETPDFIWNQVEGAFSETLEEGRIAFTGAVHFTGHGGAMELDLADPVIEFAGDDTAYLLLSMGATDTANAGGEAATSEVRAAKIDLTGVVAAQGGDLEIVSAPTRLTAEGADAFNGEYGSYVSGEELDPVSLTAAADCVLAESTAEEPTTPAEPAETAEPEQAAEQGVPWLPIIIGGVAILVIGVTGGMLIAGRGKKQPAAERETDGSSSPEA